METKAFLVLQSSNDGDHVIKEGHLVPWKKGSSHIMPYLFLAYQQEQTAGRKTQLPKVLRQLLAPVCQELKRIY